MPLVYSVFGLRLEASRPIPGLVALPPTSPVDAWIWLGEEPPWREKTREAPQPVWYVSGSRTERGLAALTVWTLDGGAYFRFLYGDGSEFVVGRTGTEVWATWPPGLTLEDTVSYLLGPILGFVLGLRGVTCLHASAIAVGGLAVAFVGPEDSGKSTTAAALAGRGYPVVADDLVALSNHDGGYNAEPGFPWLRLRPGAVRALSGAPGAFPELTPTRDECYLDLHLRQEGYRFEARSLPLGAIYLMIGRCSDPETVVEAVSPGDGLVALVANTWAAPLLDRAMRAREFELLGRLVASTPVRQICPRALALDLSKLCNAVLDDFGSLVASMPSIGHAARRFF